MKFKELSEQDKEIYDLITNQGYKFREVAKKLGITMKEVNTSISRARLHVAYNEKLERRLENPDDLYNLDIGQTALNYLERAGYTSIRRLNLDIQDGSIMKVRGMGPIVVERLTNEVNRYLEDENNSKNYEKPNLVLGVKSYLGQLKSFVENDHWNIASTKKLLIDMISMKCAVYVLDTDGVLVSSNIVCNIKENYTKDQIESMNRAGLRRVIKNIKLRIDAHLFTDSQTVICAKRFGIFLVDITSTHGKLSRICDVVFPTPRLVSHCSSGTPVSMVIGLDNVSIV